MQPTQPIDWIRAAYAERRERNASYSLRAFARDVRVPSGRLSEILSGRRRLTTLQAERIADRLGMLPDQRDAFLGQVRSKEKLDATLRRAGATLAPPDADWQSLSADAFYVVAEWEHWAILSLMRTDDWRDDVKWIAQRLGISAIEARGALDRLERVGLVIRLDGVLRRTEKNLTTSHDIPSSALRRSHRQTLEQAISCVEEYDVTERDITSVSFVTNPSRLPMAKELIREFRRRLATALEDGAEHTEVYNLNIQLVPVTKIRKGEPT